jgi:hypothetical protein
MMPTLSQFAQVQDVLVRDTVLEETDPCMGMASRSADQARAPVGVPRSAGICPADRAAGRDLQLPPTAKDTYIYSGYARMKLYSRLDG